MCVTKDIVNECVGDNNGTFHSIENLPEASMNITPIFDDNQSLYKDFLTAFKNAESHIKEAEIIDPQRDGFLIPSINELRYCSYHIVNALAADTPTSQAIELSRALSHCRRASYDALELGVITLLEDINVFTKRYVKKNLVFSDVISDYSEMLSKRNNAKDLLGVNYKDKEEHFENVAIALKDLKDIKRKLESLTDEFNAKLKQNLRPYILAVITTFVATAGLMLAAAKLFTPDEITQAAPPVVITKPAPSESSKNPKVTLISTKKKLLPSNKNP